MKSFSFPFKRFALEIVSWNRKLMISYAMSYGIGKDMINNTLSDTVIFFMTMVDKKKENNRWSKKKS